MKPEGMILIVRNRCCELPPTPTPRHCCCAWLPDAIYEVRASCHCLGYMVHLELRICLSAKSEYQASYCSGKSLNLWSGRGSRLKWHWLWWISCLPRSMNKQTFKYMTTAPFQILTYSRLFSCPAVVFQSRQHHYSRITWALWPECRQDGLKICFWKF